MTAPEPLMPLLIARKPGGKPVENLVDEATAQAAMRELAAILEAIRAAKRAYAVMLEPRGTDPYAAEDVDAPGSAQAGPDCRCGHSSNVHLVQLNGSRPCFSCPCDGYHWTQPGEVVDATIHEEWCPGVHADSAPCHPSADRFLNDTDAVFCGIRYWSADGWQECAEPAGHDGLHGDPAPRPTMADVLLAAADPDEPTSEEIPPGEHAADGPCMADGCGHEVAQHALALDTGARLFCRACACRRYLPVQPVVVDDGSLPFPVLVPCPEALEIAGPCARLAGHPMPHRTFSGHSWGFEPTVEQAGLPDCTRDGCGHAEQAHAADDEENADGPCLDADCGCGAYLLPPKTVLAAARPLAAVSFLRHDQQTLAGVRIGGGS